MPKEVENDFVSVKVHAATKALLDIMREEKIKELHLTNMSYDSVLRVTLSASTVGTKK